MLASHDEPSWQTLTPTITSPRSQTLNRRLAQPCLTVAGVDQGRKSSTAATYGPALLARPDVAQSRFGRGFPRGWAPPEQIAQALQLAAHLGLTRSNVSNHLSCLRGCGLVVATYEGRQVRYALADSHLARALGELVQVVLAVDTDQPCVAERAASGEAVEMTGS